MESNQVPYKISTITATGSIGCVIDLDNLYHSIDVCEVDDTKSEGFVYIESGKKKSDTFSKGYHKKQSKKATSTAAVTKRFDNQTTIVCRLFDEVLQKTVNINCKVFRNGNIQMTGLKYIEHGLRVLQFLIDRLPSNLLEKEKSQLCPNSYAIRLINCDFRTGFEIRRDKLCKLIQNTSEIFCNYEPCIYPGVKIRFNYNENNSSYIDGICKCTGLCCGKGTGIGNGQCKIVTISVFQSGCIIITGGQNHEQIMAAYDFINGILKHHFEHIKKDST